MNLIALEAQNERAVLAPEAGCQCLSYRVGSLDIIAGPARADEWRLAPFSSGIPILFPWPGRISGGSFSFQGRPLRLSINEPARGHAIHGLVYNRVFRITRRGPFFLHAELDSRSDPELGNVWPYPFVLELGYEVGGGLHIRARVRNVGATAMPFGFGAHPYFHAPVADRAQMRIQLSAESRWALDSNLIPSGRREPLAGKFDLRAGRAIGGEAYDDAFHMAIPADPSAGRARVINSGLAVDIFADPGFGEFVVYAPPERPVVAIEPYTCAPDAFNLATRGIDAGLRTLAPGESAEFGFEIRLSAL